MTPRRARANAERRGCAARGRLSLLTLLALVAAALVLIVFVGACGGGDKGEEEGAPKAGESAYDHFSRAQEVLGIIQMPLDERTEAEVRRELEEAAEASEKENLPEAKQHAEEALQALDALSAKLLGEHIDQGLEAAGQAPAGKPSATVQVSIAEGHVEPDRSSVPRGDVGFRVTNDGAAGHSLLILRTDELAQEFPIGRGDKVDADEVGVKIAEVEEMEPGQTAEFTVSLKRQPNTKYVLICNLSGHYGAGERADLMVR